MHQLQRLCLAVTLLIRRKEILSISMMLKMMSTIGSKRNLTIPLIRADPVDLVAVAMEGPGGPARLLRRLPEDLERAMAALVSGPVP